MQKLLLLSTLTLFLFCCTTIFAQSPTWAKFENSPDNGQRHDDVFFVDNNIGYAVRSDGYIHKTTDGGATWIEVANQPSTHFRCLAFVSATHGWAGNLGKGSFSTATDTIPLYETTDGGTTWTPVAGLAAQGVKGMCAMHVLDAQHIYGGGRVRGPAHFIKSTDGGNTWTVQNLTALGLMNGIMDVYFKDANNGFIIGMDNNPYVSSCGGTYHGRIIKTTDGGNTWTIVATTPTTCAYFWKIVFPSPNVGYCSLQQNASGYTDIKYYKTIDGGNTWTANSIPLTSLGVTSFFVQGMGCSSDNDCWIGGAYTTSPPYANTLIKTANGGTSWANVGYDDTRRWNKFRFTNPNLGYGAGLSLQVYKVPTAPAGDDPCNALAITSFGQAISGTISSSLTQSSGVPAPTNFSNTGSTAAAIWNTANICEDIWYKVTVPESGGFTASFTTTGGSSDLAMAVYSGTCTNSTPTNFTQIGADDGGTLPKIAIGCRTPNEKVYIRLWRFGCTGTGAIASYTLTINDLANVNIGEEPNNAIVLTPNNPYLSTSLSTNYNDSKGTIPQPFSCTDAANSSANYLFTKGCEDMWFTFTATQTAAITLEINNAAGGSTDLSAALYSGTCAGIIQQACDGNSGNLNNPKITYNVTAGQKYYVRVWEMDCDFTTTVTYDIRCYYNYTAPATPPTATGADNPCDASYLPFGTATTGSILASYTQTSGVPNPDLFSNTGSTTASIWNTANVCEDRWYRVQVPASGGFRFNLTSTGGSSDLAMAVYSGTCNGLTPTNFTQIGADDGGSVPKISISCRTPNEVVFIRLWRFGCTGTGTIASYSITLTDILNAPIADEPSTAIALAVNNPYSSSTLRTDHFETKGLNFPTACTSGLADGAFTYSKGCEDMWFSVDIPSTDFYNFEIDNAAGGSTDLSMAIYTGNCPGALTQAACDNDDGNGANPKIKYLGTTNQRVYVRVWENACDFTANVTFNIKIQRINNPNDLPTCSTITVPLNTLTLVEVNSVTNTNAATTFTNIPDPSGCSFFVNDSWNYEAAALRNDAWFKLVIPASGGVRIIAESTGGSGDPEMALYSTSNGQCGIPSTLVACDGDSGTGITAGLNISCRTPGEVMYVRLWDYHTDHNLVCNVYIYDITTANAGDEASNAITLPLNTPTSVNIDATVTQSFIGGVPSCGGFNSPSGCEDVWYKVVVPATGSFDVICSGASTATIGVAAYSGNCTNYTQIACTSGDNPTLSITGLTAGEIIYIRLWDSMCDQYRSFTITAQQGLLSAKNQNNTTIDKTLTPLITINGVYPNPTNGILNYEVASNMQQQVQVEVTDLTGKIILSQKLALEEGNSKQTINVNNIPNGLYLLQLQTLKGANKAIKKFSKID